MESIKSNNGWKNLIELDNPTVNNIYVCDKNMNVIGKVNLNDHSRLEDGRLISELGETTIMQRVTYEGYRITSDNKETKNILDRIKSFFLRR